MTYLHALPYLVACGCNGGACMYALITAKRPFSRMQQTGVFLIGLGFTLTVSPVNMLLRGFGPLLQGIGTWMLFQPPDDWWKRRKRSLGQVIQRIQKTLAWGVPAKRPQPA